MTPVSHPASNRLPVPARDPVLWRAAQALEAQFLSQMLAEAGLGDAPGGFEGGIGEAQFASFLRDEQASALSRSGGVGLAESIFRALSAGGEHG